MNVNNNNPQFDDGLRDFVEHIKGEVDLATDTYNLDPQKQPKNNPNEYTPTKNIWTFFLLNPRLTAIAMVASLILGLTALLNINIESNPEVSQPIGVVQTFYPNSSPSDVEEQITNPLEEEIANLSNLKEISSNSSSNISTITVTFESQSDPDEVILDLREAVSNASGKLPNDAETPRVIKFDFNNQPIVTLSVTAPLNKKELSNITNSIKQEIENVSGVGRVDISGDIEEIIKIELDPGILEHFGITITEIINKINSNNINVPLGEIANDSEQINFRLVGKAETLDQLANLPIRDFSTERELATITLGQIATITESTERLRTDSFVSSGDKEAENAISLSVFKQQGGNIVNIVDAIDSKINELNEELPNQVEIIKTNDNAFFIRKDIQTLSISGIQTIFIIFFSLLLFLTARESFIAALAIPFIFLITIAILFFTGQTLNGLTIFSLILSLGLVVDTSIVIVEGIHDYKKQGFSKIEAAAKSIETFKWPLIAGTLTTVSAFFPMLLVSGIVGDFIKTIPIVLTITLSTSLFVSFAFSPLLASKLLKTENHEDTLRNRTVTKLRNTYEKILKKILNSKGYKTIILTATVILFLASMTLPILGILKPQLFPVVDTPFTFINFEAPQGTELAETRILAKEIENVIATYEEADNYVVNLGRLIDTGGFQAGASSTSGNLGHFIINWKDIDEFERERSYIINDRLRADLDSLNTSLDITVEDISSGPPVAAPFEAKITGPDLDQLKNISDQLKSELSKISGLINIGSDFDNLPNEALLELNTELVSYYGISSQQTVLIIQALTNGIDNGTITIDGEEKDIKINLLGANKDIANTDEIANLPISTPKGTIPLSYLGEIKTNTALPTIPHLNQDRTVRVRAYTDQGEPISNFKDEIDNIISTLEMPNADYAINIGGEDEDIQKSFTELFSSMFIAVILIIIILVMVFNSFRQTIIVLVTIPLAVIGIFPGLSIIGLPLSFPAFLGVVMLTGIVVNDAIVLMDQININKLTMPIKEAISQGANSRLTPILLTSITTILGLIPITATDEFWRGLGFSVIFGLLAATFLTLFIIPILYSLFYKK